MLGTGAEAEAGPTRSRHHTLRQGCLIDALFCVARCWTTDQRWQTYLAGKWYQHKGTENNSLWTMTVSKPTCTVCPGGRQIGRQLVCRIIQTRIFENTHGVKQISSTDKCLKSSCISTTQPTQDWESFCFETRQKKIVLNIYHPHFLCGVCTCLKGVPGIFGVPHTF